MLEVKPRKEQITLNFQNYIESAPLSNQQLYGNATNNDAVTIESWRETWINQAKQNHKKYGPFKDRSLGKLFNEAKHSPVIIAGAGPSLKYNGKSLKDRGDIKLVSCLHNFHFFVDNDVDVDLYVTLDAGPLIIEEVYEGGSQTSDHYWAATKGKKLAAFIGTHPDLLERWQGEIYFFNCPIPDKIIEDEIDKLEPFHMFVSTGGNVLGAAFYIARGIFGGNPICFTGADFSFSYDDKFHGWDSKYDKKLGHWIKHCDIYGNAVKTWQSYHNFKSWFDCICQQLPGIYINCTEGGTLGAYPQGNIMAIKQMRLTEFINMYNVHYQIKDQCDDPTIGEKRILV